MTPGGLGCGVSVDSGGESLCVRGEISSLADHNTQLEQLKRFRGRFQRDRRGRCRGVQSSSCRGSGCGVGGAMRCTVEACPVDPGTTLIACACRAIARHATVDAAPPHSTGPERNGRHLSQPDRRVRVATAREGRERRRKEDPDARRPVRRRRGGRGDGEGSPCQCRPSRRGGGGRLWVLHGMCGGKGCVPCSAWWRRLRS
jgi:hypothetical protein